MRSAFATVLAMCLLVTGALVAVDLVTVFAPTLSITALNRPGVALPVDVSVVHGFYEAANAFLADEDARALTSVVSPTVKTHTGSDIPAVGHSALEERLVALQRQGGLRLSILQVVGNGDGITALIAAHGATHPGPAEPGSTAAPLWRTIERFRIEGGMIADYWPGAIESRPLPPLPAVTVSTTTEDAAVALARLELGPDVTLRALATPFPQVLMVEHGMVFVARQGALAIARAGDPGFTWQPAVPVAEEMLLGPGDALLVPPGAGQAITNPEAMPASVLSLLFTPRATLFGSKHDLTQDVLTAVAMHDPARIGRRTVWAIGVTAETLAVVDSTDTAGSSGVMELRGQHLALEPGERARPLTPASVTFAIVLSGILNVNVGAVPAPDDNPATPLPDSVAEDPGGGLLRAGNAVAIATGAFLTMENAGATSLDVMLIDVVVAPDPASPAPG